MSRHCRQCDRDASVTGRGWSPQERWLAEGRENGWIGPAVCSTHDGIPTTAHEDEVFDSGEDTCVFVSRLYLTAEEKLAVETNHAPSRWR